MAAVPGVSAITSAVSKGAQSASKAASKGASSASKAASGAAKKGTVALKGAAKKKVDGLKDQVGKYSDPEVLRKRISDANAKHGKASAKKGQSGGADTSDPFDKQSGKQDDLIEAMTDQGGKYLATGGLGAMTAKKDVARARRQRQEHEGKSEQERVKAFDKIPGVRGDADSGIGKAKRRAIRRGVDSALSSSGGALSAGAMSGAKKLVKNRHAQKAASKVVPKKVRDGVGRVARDAGRVVEETASSAVDGALKGGKVGAVTGGVKGLLRGGMQSKTFWTLAGVQAGFLALIAFVMTVILMFSTIFVSQLTQQWQTQAAMAAADTVATAKGWYTGAKEVAGDAIDGAEWVVVASAQKAAGVLEDVGVVRSGDDESEAEETADPTEEPSAEPTEEANASNSSFPTYGTPPEEWETGDPVVVGSIGDVVVDYSGSQYSVNGHDIDLVSFNDEGLPMRDYTQHIQLDLDTLAEANVFVEGRTKPASDEEIVALPDSAFSADIMSMPGSVPDGPLPTQEPTETPAPTEEPTQEPSEAPTEEEDAPEEEATQEPDDEATEEDEAEEEDRGTAAEKWGIDEEAALELGLTQDEIDTMSDRAWMQFIFQTVSAEIKEVSQEKGVEARLSAGMSVNSDGIGYVSDSGPSSDIATSTKEVYVEAFKVLPLEDIGSKAEEMFKDARQWWFGQTCTPDGTAGDSGSFTGEGVPDEAIPWIENAVKHSEAGIPAAFFAYIMDRESNFQPDVFAGDKSGGTWGLFQMNRHVWSDATGGGTFDSPDIRDPMIHTEYGAKYFDDRLETVRAMRKNNPDKPYAKDLTELEALMIAHNAGEGNLQKYPNIPAITRGYLEEFREKFEDYGGGEPGESGGGGGGDSDSGGGSSSGKLVAPQGEHPKTSDRGHRWGRFHAGTDYGMPTGTELPAMFDGTVVGATNMSGYGNYVTVKGEWDGKELGYSYAHVSSIEVSVGQKVQAGDLIALAGNTGIGTGPHLHLELKTKDFEGPGREYNTADAHKFLESNGAEVGGGATPVDPDETSACPENGESGSRGSGEVSGEECELGSNIEDGLTNSGVSVYRALCAEFPDVKSYGGRRYSSIIGNKSDHYTGKAVDAMVNDGGSNDSALGTEISDFLIANAEELDIKYIIWEQAIWYPGRDWKGMEDRGDDTQNHFDHVHVSVNS